MIRALLFFFFLSSVSWAGALTAPYDLDDTAVLPKNVRSPRYKEIFLRMENQFNGDGVAKPLGDALNTSVTFGKLANSQSEQVMKDLARGSILSQGLSLSDVAGQTTGQINTFVDVKVPVLSYGITDQTTLALVIPIYTITVQADTGFVANQNTQNWANSIKKSDPKQYQKIRDQLADPVNYQLTQDGYKPIQNRRTQAVGDLKLVSKTKIHESDRDAVALKFTVTMPTGTRPDPDTLVDTATGTGQWDLGAKALWDYRLTPSIRVGTFGGYTTQLPDELVRRIPQEEGNPVSPDKDIVGRDLGDIIETGASIVVGSSGGFNVGFGYSYQYEMPTRYYGVKYDQVRYKWLEELSPQEDLHAITVGLGYSTIDAFKAKTFALPLSADVYVNHPVWGRNASMSDVFSAELVMFF